MTGRDGLPPFASWFRFLVPTFPPVRCPLGLWDKGRHRTSCQFLGWPWWTWGKVLAQSVARYWYTLHVLPKSEERSINMPAGRRPWRDMGQWCGVGLSDRGKEVLVVSQGGHNYRSRLLQREGGDSPARARTVASDRGQCPTLTPSHPTITSILSIGPKATRLSEHKLQPLSLCSKSLPLLLLSSSSWMSCHSDRTETNMPTLLKL